MQDQQGVFTYVKNLAISDDAPAIIINAVKASFILFSYYLVPSLMI